MLLAAMMLMLSAAGASAPAPTDDDPELRCLAAFDVALGLSMAQPAQDDAAKAAKQVAFLGLLSNVTYYIGRLDERYRGMDYAVVLGHLYTAPDYAKRVDDDFARCSAEARARGAAIQAWGKKLQSLAPLHDSRPG